jgi:hypothetical protein
LHRPNPACFSQNAPRFPCGVPGFSTDCPDSPAEVPHIVHESPGFFPDRPALLRKRTGYFRKVPDLLQNVRRHFGKRPGLFIGIPGFACDVPGIPRGVSVEAQKSRRISPFGTALATETSQARAICTRHATTPRPPAGIAIRPAALESQHPLNPSARAADDRLHNPHTTMAIITTNTSRLSVVEKCERGTTIITMSTDNPNVPGNAPLLAEFSAVQDELYAAELAVMSARQTLAQMVIARDAVEKRWDGKIAQLAGFTQAATGGKATAISSAGFGVRGVNARPQPLPAPENLQASTNGFPGRTKLTWDVLDGAMVFLVEMTLDPNGQVDWKRMKTSTKTTCEVDGAIPGKPAWFRIAAVNPAGQGPWSVAAMRPVM